MALLSMMNNGTSSSQSVTSSISGDGVILLFLITVCIILIIGITWLVVKAINLMDEKKKYYKNLNKKIVDNAK